MKIPKPTKDTLITASGWIALLAAFGIGADINPESITTFFTETAQSQIAQAGFFFTMAAWIHSGRVKKEIKSNFHALTVAINHVADAFKEDLKTHGQRLDNLASRVTDLEKSKDTN